MSQLDFYFPFLMFFYGILMIFVMDNPVFIRLHKGFFGQARREAKFIWFVVVFSGLWAAQQSPSCSEVVTRARGGPTPVNAVRNLPRI